MATERFPWLEHAARTASKLNGRHASEFPKDFVFLNDSFTRPVEPQASFHLFPKLPLELRRRIWKFSLPQQRLLKVTVTAAELAYGPASQSRDNGFNNHNIGSYQSENDLGSIVSGADYYLRLGSTNTHSPLLYVNHEANAVVRRIYRVNVPITQRIPSSDAPRLRFCPKRDTILIAIERDEDKAYFADFVHDALAYDPKRKGILHIAIMDKSDLHLPVGLPDIHSRAQAALACTFRGLRSVTLVHLSYAKSRQMFSSILKHVTNDEIPQTEKVRFNRAYPLWSSNATYSILPVDPRSVSYHLELVECGWDPCRLIRAWRMLEAAYDVLPTSSEKIRMLIATTDSDESLTIANTSQACCFRQQEEFSWSCNWEEDGIYNRWYPEMPNPDNDEDLEFSKTQNAVGFWSIPLEAFGPVPEVPYDNHRWKMTRLCNLTTFASQIELGLFTLT